MSIAEVAAGLESMHEGGRRNEKRDAAGRVFALFEDRLLAFDAEAARHYGPVFRGRRQAGRGRGDLDIQIAAIARANGMAVATRNLRDFEECGVAVIDPWAPG